MRKFGLIAAAVVVGIGFWAASTKARVTPPAMMLSSTAIEPMKMMTVSAHLPSEHFVDYSLIYP